MATINVKDAAGSTVALEKPLTPGQAAMAASRPVVLASDQSSIPVAATLGAETTKNIGTVRMGDGTNTAAVKAASTAPVATDPAIVVAMSPNTQNANGQATMANSTPIVMASDFVSTSGYMKKEDVASADGDAGVGMLVVRKATPANSSGTDGDYEFPQMSGGYLWVHDNKGLSNLAFVAAFTTLTRPANTTAYTAADSISDNATAGSVTALSATIADVNDDPIFISDIIVKSTDTGLAGKKVRAYLFNADPTASTGVGAGDNVAYSQKMNGYIGSFMGWMETGFSDGTVGRLVPCFNETNFTQAGGFVVAKPTSGAKTLFIQYQAVEAFTPSANSTTIIGTARGWQGRAV